MGFAEKRPEWVLPEWVHRTLTIVPELIMRRAAHGSSRLLAKVRRHSARTAESLINTRLQGRTGLPNSMPILQFASMGRRPRTISFPLPRRNRGRRSIRATRLGRTKDIRNFLLRSRNACQPTPKIRLSSTRKRGVPGSRVSGSEETVGNGGGVSDINLLEVIVRKPHVRFSYCLP